MLSAPRLGQLVAMYTRAMNRVTRRSFVTAVGAVVLAPGGRLLASPATGARGHDASAYLFLDAAEARFIESACARLIPADPGGAGAAGAGACRYVDAQLAGRWGSGEHLHRDGSWQPGTPARRRATTPAGLFRAALGGIDQVLRRHGTSFDSMHGHAQDVFLEALRCGRVDLGVPSPEFFELLLQMTAEAFFSNPLSMARDRIAWPLAAFPGAHAAFS
jgi:gluconate 2-dehydrogenase gamma chain